MTSTICSTSCRLSSNLCISLVEPWANALKYLCSRIQRCAKWSTRFPGTTTWEGSASRTARPAIFCFESCVSSSGVKNTSHSARNRLIGGSISPHHPFEVLHPLPHALFHGSFSFATLSAKTGREISCGSWKNLGISFRTRRMRCAALQYLASRFGSVAN